MGTSAEFASFDERERQAAIGAIVQRAGGRVPIIANASDASTRLAVRHARNALAEGANAVAVTPPYYYPHSQDEVLSHLRAIRAAVDAPLFMYNIPQTVRVRIELKTAQTLAAEGTVAGIKDSQNDLEWLRQLALFARERDLDFTVFAGTRSLIDAALLIGAHGAIPSVANAFPDLCVATYERMRSSQFAGAREYQDRIVAIESVSGSALGGSRNASVLALLKLILADRGGIDHATLTSPLRMPPADEAQRWLSAVNHLAGTPSAV
ncbi:MAG: dihydrodipicolinate synthase family protein [Chloroflexota bacterium]